MRRQRKAVMCDADWSSLHHSLCILQVHSTADLCVCACVSVCMRLCVSLFHINTQRGGEKGMLAGSCPANTLHKRRVFNYRRSAGIKVFMFSTFYFPGSHQSTFRYINVEKTENVSTSAPGIFFIQQGNAWASWKETLNSCQITEAVKLLL